MNDADTIFWFVVLGAFVGIVVAFAIMALFCGSLSRALEAIDQPLREQSPRSAWLLLIPVFNAIWFFFLVVAVNKGYERMTTAGRLTRPSDGAKSVGMSTAILWLLCFVPYANIIAGIAGVVLFIVYWTRLVEMRGLVLPGGGAGAVSAPTPTTALSTVGHVREPHANHANVPPLNPQRGQPARPRLPPLPLRSASAPTANARVVQPVSNGQSSVPEPSSRARASEEVLNSAVAARGSSPGGHSPEAQRNVGRESHHRSDSPRGDQRRPRRSWAIPVVASLVLALGAAGAWWLFKEQQRSGDLAVAKLKSEIAELSKQTADLKAALNTTTAAKPPSDAQRAAWEAGRAAAAQRLQDLKDANAPVFDIREAEKALADYPKSPGDAAIQAHKQAALRKASDSLLVLHAAFPTDRLPPLLDETLRATASGDSQAIGSALDQFAALPLPKARDAKAAHVLNADGQAHLSKGEVELAAERLSEAALLDMTDPVILDNFALALAKAGEPQKSASAALMALAVDPSRASTWQTLATTFSRMDSGASPRAVLMLQNAYRFTDDPGAAKARIERLGREESHPGVKQLAAAVLPTLPTIKPYSVR